MKCFVYIAIASENRISTYALDSQTGALAHITNTELGGAPGPLALAPNKKTLYVGVRSTRHIASFRIDHATGDLSPTGTVSLEADPCYLSTDRKGNFLLSAYYGGGLIAVHPLHKEGSVGNPHVVWHKTAPKAHCVLTDPSNTFAFLPHVGESNAIFQFRFNETTGELTPNQPPHVSPEPGVGPRHFVFHPQKDIVYVSNEQGSSVTAYRFDPSAGTLSAFQTLSTLPEGFSGENSCAQIHITPSGKYLYVSNRGHDSIACYATGENGSLTALGQQPTEPAPRAFGIDPTGSFLFAGGQPSGNLASYRINPNTGALTPLEVYPVGKQSMWVLFLQLPD
ncbi:MAG: lactonase family protein [bacterium]|nr:lactonase family protein [bacterium]